MKNKIILGILILISAMLHFYDISKPAKPVFDEAYYATFASNYANHKASFDVHPPVGKFIYSIPLLFYKDKQITDAEFIKKYQTKINSKDTLDVKITQKDYDKFPYVFLRYTSAIFGILLMVAVFYFARNISGSETVGLMSSFLIVFENALLLESRLILLNIMILVFGITALTLFFSRKPKPIIGGVFWGLAIGVKWIAVSFPGIIIATIILNKNKEERRIIWKNLGKFFITGLIAYLIAHIAITTILVPIQERLNLYESLTPWLLKNDNTLSNIALHTKAFLTEISTSLYDYTVGMPWMTEISSHWYEWPLMIKTISYSFEPLIVLVGNPFVWFGATTAVLFAISKLFKYKLNSEKYQKYFVLLGGYVLALVPLSLVNRATFLYHYFPAYIFGIILAVMILKDFLNEQTAKNKKIYGAIIIIMVVANFIIVAPYTYGIYN